MNLLEVEIIDDLLTIVTKLLVSNMYQVEIIDLSTLVTKLLVSNMYRNVAEKTSQSSGEKSFSTSKHNI